MNPYQPPLAEADDHAASPITDDMVRQIIAGEEVETIVVPFNSDLELHGWKHRRRLAGELREAALAAGLEPYACQSVYWFCVLFVPLVPRGVYVVMRHRTPDDDDERAGDDAHRYRALPADWDHTQVLWHLSATIAIGLTLAGLLAISVLRW